jgi:hypothetical protein
LVRVQHAGSPLCLDFDGNFGGTALDCCAFAVQRIVGRRWRASISRPVSWLHQQPLRSGILRHIGGVADEIRGAIMQKNSS